MLRKPRLNEKVATDTYFASSRSLEGYTCAQIFFGCTSLTINVYSMKTESEFSEVYKDFMNDRGIPHILKRDNGKSEQSAAIKELHCDLLISDEFTEPHHPQQNPAELNGVKFFKSHAQVLMDRNKAPNNTWFLAQKYIADSIMSAPTCPITGRYQIKFQVVKHQIFHIYFSFIGLNLCCI